MVESEVAGDLKPQLAAYADANQDEFKFSSPLSVILPRLQLFDSILQTQLGLDRSTLSSLGQ